jgi:DNA adenine methylase
MRTHPKLPLKWAGGKQRLIEVLRTHIPRRRRLIEPFVGGGSVFLSLDGYPGGYLLGDANADLAALWQRLKVDPGSLIARCRPFFSADYHCPHAYYAVREQFNRATCDVERTARFIYLNRFGFNGLYRVNRRGQLNTPYGYPQRLPAFPEAALWHAAARLQSADVVHGDFASVMRFAGAGDVVYADPPYLVEEGAASCHCSYTAGGFTFADHARLVESARAAARRGAVVVISNHDSDVARRLYRHFRLECVSVRRSLASDPARRKPARELLAVLEP